MIFQILCVLCKPAWYVVFFLIMGLLHLWNQPAGGVTGSGSITGLVVDPGKRKTTTTAVKKKKQKQKQKQNKKPKKKNQIWDTNANLKRMQTCLGLMNTAQHLHNGRSDEQGSVCAWNIVYDFISSWSWILKCWLMAVLNCCLSTIVVIDFGSWFQSITVRGRKDC